MSGEVERMEDTGGLTRRGLLGWVAGGLVGLGVLFNAVPFVGALLGSTGGAAAEGFVDVGPVAALPSGQPTDLTFTQVQQDAYVRETVAHSVWAVRHPAGDVVVYSPICPHLGCQYGWDGATKRFVCPCHTSIWDIDGKLLSGPSPRNLDTLPSKVENGRLLVRWVQYKVATPEKIPIG